MHKEKLKMKLKPAILTLCLIGLLPEGLCFKSSKSERKLEVQKADALKKDLISTSVNRLEGKHLYMNGKTTDLNGNPLDSFMELSGNPDHAKQYLIDLNRKVYQGGILPEARGNQINLWYDNIQNAKLTIIDADISTLKADIGGQFNDWKSKQILTPDGKLSPSTRMPNFMTENPVRVTHLTFHLDEGGNVVVKAEQLRSKVELGTDEYGKPSHFERLDPMGPEAKLQVNENIASFSRHELEANAKTTRKFWKDLGISANAGNVLLNDNHALYQGLQEMADNDFKKQVEAENDGRANIGGGDNLPPGTCTGRSKRATGLVRKCAINLKPNGEVESISPKEFAEEYKRASETEKQQMAELVKNNEDKVVVKQNGDDSDAKKMRKLVELEDLKSHVSSVETVGQVEQAGTIKSQQMDGGSGGDVEGKPVKAVEDLATKLGKVKGKVKLSGSKLARGLTRIASTNIAKGFTKKVGKVSNPLSKFFLAKTVINGIIQGDTTSLAIVGGRVGYEVVTGTAVWAGTKYFSEASKMGKATKALGKIAGPIAAAFDIGLSVWSMTKSIQRLNNATNRFDRDDAIADIVSDAVDIGVTAAVTVLSIAAPPAAPFLIAVGAVIDLLTKLAVALFKGINEVQRINAEVPLLDFEKGYVFSTRFFDWFGTRSPDYIDSLLKEKGANDLAVQHSLNFLQNNQNFLGIVFPSRTIHYDGGCRLTKRRCKLKNASGCTSWKEERYTVSSGCDWRGPCSSTYGICENHWVRVGVWGYDDFTCECSKSAETTYGYPRSNSVVNLGIKRSVYLQRSVPKDVKNAEFLCKPGNLNYIDYKVSQKDSTWAHLCENAIGLLQPSHRRRSGQAILFDLEDGKDSVLLGNRYSTPTVFRMGNDGEKEYLGGGEARNEFLFDSTCSGSLTGSFGYGNETNDAIIIGEQCARGQEISADLKWGRLRSSGNNLNMRFHFIGEFIGRERERENVGVGCSTRRVMTRGGSSSAWMDEVTIPVAMCNHNVTVFGAPYTKIVSETMDGCVTILLDNAVTGMVVEMNLWPTRRLKLNVNFLKTSSSQINGWSLTKQGKQLQLDLVARNDRIQFVFTLKEKKGHNATIHFTEEPRGSPNSVLFLSEADGGGSVIFYHSLPSHGGYNRRTGCSTMENVFEIGGSGWYVTGGDKADEFIINSREVWMIDGGGGVDTVKFHQSFREIFIPTVDLTSGFKNVENVHGVAGVPLTVKTACDTMLVATEGGSRYRPDLITVPGGHCSRRNLQILAVGNTRVVVESGRNEMASNDVVKVVASGYGQSADLQFQLDTGSTQLANLLVAVVLSHRNWNVVESRRNTQHQSIFVHLEGSSDTGKKEWIKLNLTEDLNSNNAPYLQTPMIQVSVGSSSRDVTVPGVLVFAAESIQPKMMYQITGSEPSGYISVNGFADIENMFQLTAGDRDWGVTGGLDKDTFVIVTTTRTGGRYYINGGGGREKTVIIDSGDSSSETLIFLVNLEKPELGYLSSPLEKRGVIWHIDHIIGRVNAPDHIYPICNTKTVNGRGGRGEGHQQDVIQIGSRRCYFDLTVAVGGFTSVKSTAPVGRFIYHIDDLLTSSLEIQPTSENRHFLKFSFHPWEVITAVAFNASVEAMGWKISNGDGIQEEEKIQVFVLSKPSPSTDYNNPVFEFHPPGSSVSSDIRVGSEGITMATFMINGVSSNPNRVIGLSVDVNRFLVNITSQSSDSSTRGSIQGCADGSRCSANQFWIMNLISGLELLDGGACENSGCTNYLHFTESAIQNQLHVDMDISHGSVKRNDDTEVISQLKNIHELHGTRGMFAYVSADTSKVSGAERVYIKGDTGPLDIIIAVETYTKVWFQELVVNDSLNDIDMGQDELDKFFESIVHYRFTGPMSFYPEGDYATIIRHNHNYYLSFKLNSLSSLRFDLDQDRLYYKLDETEYYFSMISAPAYNEQFYSQPNIVTQDGYKIQIARDGSMWATLGNHSQEITANLSVAELQSTANQVGVTMVLQTDTDFYFIGHSVQQGQDRNVLESLKNLKSHLAGGGANDTIYEITHLNKDVYIYSGYDDDEDYWTTENDIEPFLAKQTIDFTDIIVPIRLQSGTKYVPEITSNGNDLQIFMLGYEEFYPGKVVIVEGVFPWVAERLQILLNNAIMDLVPSSHENEIIKKRKRSIETINEDNMQWRIRPRPVIIPEDITIFSISPEDLEDGQDIQFKPVPPIVKDNANETEGEATPTVATFKAVRNGSDLLMTNVMGLSELSEVRTVIISDFYHVPPQPSIKINETDYDDEIYQFNSTGVGENETAEEYVEEMTMSNRILGVTINFPGLSLMLNETDVLSVTVEENSGTENLTEIIETEPALVTSLGGLYIKWRISCWKTCRKLKGCSYQTKMTLWEDYLTMTF